MNSLNFLVLVVNNNTCLCYRLDNVNEALGGNEELIDIS